MLKSLPLDLENKRRGLGVDAWGRSDVFRPEVDGSFQRRGHGVACRGRRHGLHVSKQIGGALHRLRVENAHGRAIQPREGGVLAVEAARDVIHLGRELFRGRPRGADAVHGLDRVVENGGRLARLGVGPQRHLCLLAVHGEVAAQDAVGDALVKAETFQQACGGDVVAMASAVERGATIDTPAPPTGACA